MIKDDAGHHTKRANAEMKQAQRAANRDVPKGHRQLAHVYFERVMPDAQAVSEQAT